MAAWRDIVLALGLFSFVVALVACGDSSIVDSNIVDSNIVDSSIVEIESVDDAATAPPANPSLVNPAGMPPPVARPAPAPGPWWRATSSSPLADVIQPLDVDARVLPMPEDQPVPTGIDLPSIGVQRAPIVSVGVESNGDFEVPPAEEVGWYQFGPTPGANGSAVLAAHIAYNGRDGVFRMLDRLEPGDRFTVNFDGAPNQEFRVESLAQYPKNALPEDLFDKFGEPRLVLITCGGSFNRQLSSYDDNVVAIAVPA